MVKKPRALVHIQRRCSLRRLRKQIKNFEDELLDDFLELLLDMMLLAFLINFKHCRKNIEGFRATYNFVSRDGTIAAAAIFANNKMKMKKEKVPDNDPDLKVTLTFKNGPALRKFLISGTPDVLNSLLAQEIDYSGNLNYLLKFAYLVKAMF
jgi:hypothetical protein